MMQSSRYAQKIQPGKMRAPGVLPQMDRFSPNLQAVLTRSRSFALIVALHACTFYYLQSDIINQTLVKAWPQMASLASDPFTYFL